MKDEKIVNLLSMAQRAGRVASGDTKKLYRNMAEKADIPVYEAMDKESLGNAIGKAQRAAAVLLDRGFSDALKKRLESNQ